MQDAGTQTAIKKEEEMFFLRGSGPYRLVQCIFLPSELLDRQFSTASELVLQSGNQLHSREALAPSTRK